MRRILGSAFVSLDGVMQAPGGPSEDPTGGFAHGGWLPAFFDEDVGQAIDALFDRDYALLLGRRTYDIFAAYWPYVGGEATGIGEIFDKVYSEGSPTTGKNDVQTTLVAPGGATLVEFKLNYPGSYLLVDHALSRVGKGLVGALAVQGVADTAIYQPLNGAAEEHQH